MTTSKQFKVIILDENSKVYKANTIESNNPDFNKDVSDNYDKFLNGFSKDYIIKNVTNSIKDFINPLFKKSTYFGYPNPYRSVFIPGSGGNITTPPINNDTGTAPVDTETSLSNLIGVVNRLESVNIKSPFPDKVTDEEWTKFIISEFHDEETDTNNDVSETDTEDNIDEGLSFKTNNLTHISILERKFKREINDIKKSIDNLRNEKNIEENINNQVIKEVTGIYKEINRLKTDIQILFEKVSDFLPKN